MNELQQIGHYRVTGKLGAGSFGTVYQGVDPEAGQPVAIKLCALEDEGLRKRFSHEAQIAAGLRHENIVEVLTVDTAEDGSPYLVQELLGGVDLRTLIEQRAPLAPRRKLEILIGLARGLGHGHAHGVVHRAVHPGNVWVLEDGGVKVLDFGVAKVASAETELTRESVELGTAGYQPPEQVRGGDIDHRADLFSFGVIAYELLAGERPFSGTTLSALVYQILYKVPAPLDALWTACPESLGELVGRCLEKKQERRFHHLGEVVTELEILRAEIDAGRWPALSNVSSSAGGQGTELRSPSELRRGVAAPGEAGTGYEEQEELGEYTISTAKADAGAPAPVAPTPSPEATQIIEPSPLTTQAFNREALEEAADARAAVEKGGLENPPPGSSVVDPAAETLRIPRPRPAAPPATALPAAAPPATALPATAPDLESKAEQIRELIVAGELESAMEKLESTLSEKRESSSVPLTAEPVAIEPAASSTPPSSAPSPIAPPTIAPPLGESPPVRQFPPPSASTTPTMTANGPAAKKGRPASQRRGAAKLWVGAATLLAIIIVAWIALRPVDQPTSTDARAEPASGAPASTEPESPASSAGPRSAVAINAVPWGEVTEITDVQGYLQAIPDDAVTPLRLELPPGSYVIHLLHPDHPEPRICEVEIRDGLDAVCSVTFGEAPSVEEYFRASGWWL